MSFDQSRWTDGGDALALCYLEVNVLEHGCIWTLGVGECDAVECNGPQKLWVQCTPGLLGVSLEFQQSAEIARCLHRFYNSLTDKGILVNISWKTTEEHALKAMS
jgi:hypothetical protein